MPELMERVLAYLSPFDIIHFKLVCQWFHRLGDTFYRHAYNVERILGSFFPNAVASFQSTQRRTGAIICGSIALRFFDRLEIKENTDLDVFIQEGRERSMVKWLIQAGYELVKNEKEDKVEEDNITPPNHDYTADVVRHDRYYHPIYKRAVEIVLSYCSPWVAILHFNLCT